MKILFNPRNVSYKNKKCRDFVLNIWPDLDTDVDDDDDDDSICHGGEQTLFEGEDPDWEIPTDDTSADDADTIEMTPHSKNFIR